jgi:tetratricopeptide (TPR) repeat protein
VLPLRVGEHDDHSRLVFDLAEPAAYDVDNEDGTVRIRIATRAALGPLPAELPSRVGAIDSTPGEHGLSVRLRLASGAHIKHFRSGAKIVVDVFGPEVPASARATAQAKATPKSEPAAKPPTQLMVQSSAPVPPATKPLVVSPMAAPAVVSPASSPAAARARDAAPVEGPVHVTVTHLGESTVIHFGWPQSADPAAAVFIRAGYLWAVFDREARLDFPGWQRADGAPQNRAVGAGATAFRLKLADPELAVRVTRDGGEWVATLSPDAVRPKTPSIEVRKASDGHPRLFVAASEPGSRVMIVDPEAGNTLFVVPLRRPGIGMAAERRYTDVRFLATGQGIVIEPLTDGVAADVSPSGIEVASARGLNLTPAAVRAAAVEEPVKPGRIFDFDGWRTLGGGSPDARVRLQQAVLNADAPERNARRLDLARYHFAKGAYAEALGVIEAIAVDQPETAEEPEVKALRGAARLEMNDIAGASRDLMSPVLDGERDVAPWRGAVAAAQRDWEEALRQFARGEPLLGHYPPALRVQFALTDAEAAIESGDPEQARVALALVATLNPSGAAVDRSHWLMGRMYAAFGEYDSAEPEWTQAMNGGDPWVRVRARFDRAMALLKAGRMSRGEAIAELDKLRFSWRGDLFEYKVLTTLGDLYLADGNMRKGLEALKRAVTNFPEPAAADSVATRMRDAFVQFHVGGAAAKMPTLAALALFQEFRDLVPEGSTGDTIIAQLAGRLVEVDLLGEAAGLLTDLADRRLKGPAESQARNQLGLVLLMDRKPQRAAEALDRPVAAGADDATVAARRHLRARALMDISKFSDALRVLNGDESPEATELRADLYWRTNEWKLSAANFAKLTAPLDAAKLSEGDVRLVMRQTIALALAGDARALAGVGNRFGPAMAATPFKDGFAILTDSERLTPANLRTIMAQVSAAERFGAFLESYRTRLLKSAAPNAAAGKAPPDAPHATQTSQAQPG